MLCFAINADIWAGKKYSENIHIVKFTSQKRL